MVVVPLSGFGVSLATARFPVSWEAALSTVARAVTLVMLFIVQHTRSRNQVVLQLKLDELIRSSPDADALPVHLEVADDAEPIVPEPDQLAHHESLRRLGEEERGDNSQYAPASIAANARPSDSLNRARSPNSRTVG